MLNKDKFAPRVEGTKTEKTGQRNSAYSLWHRSLGAESLAVDIDFVEFREGKGIVAFLAVTGECVDENHIINSKKYIWDRTKLERKILITLSVKVNVPSYFVIHNNDLTIFHVHNLSKELTDYTKMNREEYAFFIKNL